MPRGTPLSTSHTSSALSIEVIALGRGFEGKLI